MRSNALAHAAEACSVLYMRHGGVDYHATSETFKKHLMSPDSEWEAG